MKRRNGPPSRKTPNGVSKPLSARQERFCHEYVKDLNATQAAKRAGYSPKTSDVIGPRLLDNVGVHLLVERLKQQINDASVMSARETLQEITRIARSSIKRAFSPTGKLLSPLDMDEDAAAAISSFEVQSSLGEDGASPCEIRKIKLWDKMAALRFMAMHHKLIGPEVHINLGAELADRLARARKRARAED
jgi:phage terminase small subunit